MSYTNVSFGINYVHILSVTDWANISVTCRVVSAVSGAQWRNAGLDVHVVSVFPDSRAVSILLHRQLACAPHPPTTPRPGVVRHHDLNIGGSGDISTDISTAVGTLASLAPQGGPLFVLMDEVYE